MNMDFLAVVTPPQAIYQFQSPGNIKNTYWPVIYVAIIYIIYGTFRTEKSHTS